MTRRSQPPYPPELRERAVRMVAEVRYDYESPWAALNAVAEKLGVGTGERVRKRVRGAEIDGGLRPGTTTEESEELKRLSRERGTLSSTGPATSSRLVHTGLTVRFNPFGWTYYSVP